MTWPTLTERMLLAFGAAVALLAWMARRRARARIAQWHMAKIGAIWVAYLIAWLWLSADDWTGNAAYNIARGLFGESGAYVLLKLTMGGFTVVALWITWQWGSARERRAE